MLFGQLKEGLVMCHAKEIAELRKQLASCTLPQKELALIKKIKQLEQEDAAEKDTATTEISHPIH